MSKMITIRLSREKALEHGLLICKCGHPGNNHFDDHPTLCSLCNCKNYREIARVGKLQKASK